MLAKLLATIGIVGALSLGVTWASYAPTQETQQDQASRRDLMRTKLMFTQNIVEGLSIRRFDMIEAAASEIEQLTHAEMWLPEKTPELQKVSDELVMAAKRLKKAAASQNLEGTTLRYFELTLKCIDCHQMLRKADF